MATGTIKQNNTIFPNYDTGAVITLNSTYTAPSDGYVLLLRVIMTGAATALTINGAGVYSANNPNVDLGGAIYPVKKGDIIVTAGLDSSSRVCFLSARS